ncbi:MAG: M12 family metallo-peptidase, partial [Pseudomonadota bacterium]
DVEIPAGLMRCSHVGHAGNAMQLMSAVGESTSRPDVMRALGATEVIDVAVVADFEFTDEFGTDTTAELLSRMNIVDEIFSQQLGIQITVSHIDTFPAANDPFSDEADPELLLNELADFRADSADHRSAGITHLFTGRSLNGSSVGIAFSEALCSSRFSAGLTELQRNDFFGSTPVDALIAAHELGHNFGAPHDGEIGSPCEAVTENRLMSVNVNGSDQFSACSIAEMQDDIAAANCIRLLIATDVEVEAGTVPSAVDQGAGVQLVFDVNNVGTEVVNNAAIDITIPATVALNSIVSTVGSCSSGAGSANCTIGTLASGAGATITLETTAESIGSANFEARVTADDDLVDTNNTVFSSFSIRDPAPPPTPVNDDDDSGGGSFGWPMLLALAGLARSRRRSG